MKKIIVFRLNDKIHNVKAVSVISDAEILFSGELHEEIPADIQALVDTQEQQDLTEKENVEYKEKRKKEYPIDGDQLDVIWKQFNYMRLNGQDLIQEADDMLGGILAVKNKYPKPN